MFSIKSLLVTGVVALAAFPAMAATVVTDHNQPSYTGLLAAPTNSSAGFRLNYQGSDLVAPSPNSRTPWEDFAGLADTAYYNSVEGGGFAEYTFAAPQTSFSLMWGSPDDYNTLSFFDQNGLVYAIDGDDAAITSTPGWVNGRSFVNVTISDLSFSTVRFESTGDAFEFSNVAAVPLPAALPLLIAGLGAVGGLRMRRKRAS